MNLTNKLDNVNQSQPSTYECFIKESSGLLTQFTSELKTCNLQYNDMLHEIETLLNVINNDTQFIRESYPLDSKEITCLKDDMQQLLYDYGYYLTIMRKCINHLRNIV